MSTDWQPRWAPLGIALASIALSAAAINVHNSCRDFASAAPRARNIQAAMITLLVLALLLLVYALWPSLRYLLEQFTASNARTPAPPPAAAPKTIAVA